MGGDDVGTTNDVTSGTESWEQDRERFVRNAVDRVDCLDDERRRAQRGTPERSEGGHDYGPLAREFSRLAGALLSSGSVAEVLTTVISTACVVIPSVHMASITLRDSDGTFHTPVFTDQVAEAIDQEQYRSGRGPCVEAARADGPAMAAGDDLTTDDRWPEFAQASLQAGFGSVLATSLIVDDDTHLPGALNLYSRGRQAFVPADRDRALLLATHASLALATTAAVSAAELERTQLRTAVGSRDVIGQAKGILMARRGLSAEEAFDVLRRTSQDINVKLVDLARTVTENHDALDSAGR